MVGTIETTVQVPASAATAWRSNPACTVRGVPVSYRAGDDREPRDVVQREAREPAVDAGIDRRARGVTLTAEARSAERSRTTFRGRPVVPEVDTTAPTPAGTGRPFGRRCSPPSSITAVGSRPSRRVARSARLGSRTATASPRSQLRRTAVAASGAGRTTATSCDSSGWATDRYRNRWSNHSQCWRTRDHEPDSARGRLEAGRRRLHRHPLRDRRRHRQDHDLSARGAQRLPARARCSSCATRSSVARDDPDDRRDRPHRRGPRRVLLRRRSADSRRRRLRRRRRDRPAQRARPADPDPAVPEAGGRDGRGVRDRRRTCAARGVRPDDRRGQRAVRPDRAEGRILRRRLRLGPARAIGRPEEGARDLDPVPTVRRASRRSTWAWSTPSCRSPSSRRRRSAWCREMLEIARSRCG